MSSDRKQRIKDFLTMMTPLVFCPGDLVRAVTEDELSTAHTLFELGCAFQRSQPRARLSNPPRLLEVWDQLWTNVQNNLSWESYLDARGSEPIAKAVCEMATVPTGVELVVMEAPVEVLEHPETGHRRPVLAEIIGVLDQKHAAVFNDSETSKAIAARLSMVLEDLQKRAAETPGARAYFCFYWPPMRRTEPTGPYHGGAPLEAGSWSMRGSLFVWEHPKS